MSTEAPEPLELEAFLRHLHDERGVAPGIELAAIANLLAFLVDKGLVDEVGSWLSFYESNQSVSAEQILEVMPGDVMAAVSAVLRMSAEQAAAALGTALPAFIDSIRPDKEEFETLLLPPST